jgi:hypothetical protein
MLALEITDPAGIRLLGRLPLVYQTIARPGGTGAGTTLRGDIALPRSGSLLARARSTALAWGDLVMMGRQLRRLARLSEETAGLPRSP